MKLDKYLNKVKVFLNKVYLSVLRFTKWFKGLSRQELKNYSLNLISCLLILSVFITSFLTSSRDDKKFDLFSARKIADNIRNLELNMTSVVYAKNEDGEWVEHKRLHGDENRIWVSLDNIPKDLQNAFIAIEDEDFEKHHGVDWQRTILAVANQLFKFSAVDFGASTITQQLVKNITSDNERLYTRKIREIVRSIIIETELSKNEILEAYLNTIALGNGINGVRVAANYYFSKEVDELTLAEIAAIAAITKNPSKYNPASNMKENQKRRRTVLVKMFELGFISEKELQDAYYEKIKLDFSQKEEVDGQINDYFVDTLIEEVIEDLAEKFGCDKKIASQMFYNSGFKIYSTMETSVQSAMEEVYLDSKRYFYEKKRNDDGELENVQSAMTILDYNGNIVGIVGGAGEKTVNRGLNRAYNVPRQPGSTMKPLGVYSLLIDNNLADYTTTVLDQPIKHYYPDGRSGPREWFGGYMDKVPLNYALRHSMNAVPVRLLDDVGIENSYEFLTQKLGFKHLVEKDKNASALALGGCTYGITPTESAAAFAVFGNGGMYYEPTTYKKIVDIDGKVILENKNKGKRAIGEDTATIMNRLLREVVYKEGGTGRTVAGYNYRMKCYAKTGTSSEKKDSWLAGGTPYYVGSVWYGYDHNQNISNANMAKTIWRDVMRKIHENLMVKEFEDSKNVYEQNGAFYKKGTKPGIIIPEEEYLKPESSSEESSSSQLESSNVSSDVSTTPESSSSDISTSIESSSSESEESSSSSQESNDENSPTDSPDQTTGTTDPPVTEEVPTPEPTPPEETQ